MNTEPIAQRKIYGLDYYFNEIVDLYNNNKLPNKILLSGPKGNGKSTLAYHIINYIFSKNETNPYNFEQKEISDQIQETFSNAKKTKNTFKSSADPSGESLIHAIYFDFDSGGSIQVTCYEFSKKVTSTNGLDVAISSAEHNEWLSKFHAH